MVEGIAVSTVAGNSAVVEAALRLIERNRLEEAEGGLCAILSSQPDHPQALQLLGVVRKSQGRMDEAESLYRRSLAIDPAQPQVHHNLGILLGRTGKREEAVAALAEAIRQRPNYAEAHLNLALVLAEAGDHQAAEKCCRDALRYQPNYRLAQQTLATELCALGRAREAEQLLRRVLAVSAAQPRQAAALEHTLAMALKQQERFEEALTLFDAAQAKVPDLPAVDFNRGGTLQQLGRTEESAEAYRRAAARDPAHAESLAGLALMSVLTADFATARTAGMAAISLSPQQPIACVALAIADIEAGAFDEAESRLHRVSAQPSFRTDKQASFALGFAADAFERRGQFKQAFEWYRLSNTARRELHSGLQVVRAKRDVDRLSAYFDSCAPWPRNEWQHDRNASAGHVLVLGFMRSGTTVLETVLSTNPRVVSIDEIEFLTDAAREFLLDDDELARLAALSPQEAARWRAAYWSAVRSAGLSVAGKIFIDKMPFNSLRLPLIARLFPDAKIVFALRDPRDVVISCYRRRFNPTAFAYEFFELEDCARFYASSMALVELYRKKLPIRLHDHRYENMVTDFDASVRATCEFVGLDFDPAMREFRGKAREIDRRSASAAQVRRGLYPEGIGQWRHYREQMAPVLPILEPWVARFGYSIE